MESDTDTTPETGATDGYDDFTEADDFDWSDDASQDLSKAKAGLAEARREHEKAVEERNRARDFLEKTIAEAESLRNHLEECVAGGISFLNRKLEELASYLSTAGAVPGPPPEVGAERGAGSAASVLSPAATTGGAMLGGAVALAGRLGSAASSAAGRWLKWTPTPGHVYQRRELARRFDLDRGCMEELTSRWRTTDDSFRRQLETLRERYVSASTSAERDAVRTTSQRGASGRLGELFAEHAFRPFARSMETRRRTVTPDGQVTISDMVLRNTAAPVDLGNRILPAGSSVGVETKCGRAVYLKSQLTHMGLQVDGHHAEDASFCFLSRDFSKLSTADKRDIVRALGQRRAKVYAILPEKAELDSLVWQQIAGP